MEQNDSVESCRIIVGYDDLIVKAFGDKSVLLQKGRFWDFTCSRKLTGEASGNGAVVANTVNDGPEVGNLTTEFSLDITCCDPDDKTCKQVGFTFKEVQFSLYVQCLTSEDAPIIHIGPKAEPLTSFFVDLKFNNTNYEHKDEHLHIQECKYMEYDGNNQPTDTVTLIQNGCDMSNQGFAKFKRKYFTIFFNDYYYFYLIGFFQLEMLS